jgi:divalent metal cation (Fe/Co/Zn/Cd) transporter
MAAGLANLALGAYLVRTGRAFRSLALVADGQHVLADFWTSAGIVVGLLLVRLTGLWWLDPLIAAAVALNLMWTGYRLVRYAAGGLLTRRTRRCSPGSSPCWAATWGRG